MATLRFWLAGILLLFGMTPVPASAQSASERPITLICPWPPGGQTCNVLRLIAEQASKLLGQAIVIDYRPGASGTLGPSHVARTAKPDGYTISQGTINILRISLMQRTDINPLTDYTYIIGLIAFENFGILVSKDSPFRTIDGLLAFAKARPGEVTFYSLGIGSTNHLLMEKVSIATGAKFTHVPFKGASEAITALRGGHVAMGVDVGWDSAVESGTLRVLATFGEKRSRPDVPTMRERFGPDLVAVSPWGLVGPKGMPANVVARLHDAFRAAIESPSPALQEYLRVQDMTVWYRSSADFRAWADASLETERALLGRLGLLAN